MKLLHAFPPCFIFYSNNKKVSFSSYSLKQFIIIIIISFVLETISKH